jgi:hypothetical protein
MPGGGFGDEAGEEGAGGWAIVVRAFGMPLDPDDEGGAGACGGGVTHRVFDCFDDAVFRATGGDAEAVSRNADGLVVAGVDLNSGFEVRGSGFEVRCDDLSEQGILGHNRRVGGGDGAAGGVVHGHWHEVLDQGATAPDVEHLGPEADGEDGFAHIVGVLEEELIYILAGGVGRAAFGIGLLAVFLRVHVGGGAGKEDALAVGYELGCSCRLLIQLYFYGLCSAAFEGLRVLLPGAAVIFQVGGGGNGDGYAGLLHKA